MAVEPVKLLEWAVGEDVSDLHMTPGQCIFYRRNGKIFPRVDIQVTEELLSAVLEIMVTDSQRERLIKNRELDFSWELNHRRFRGNLYFQRNVMALALRLIPNRIPSLEELGASTGLKELFRTQQGFMLVTGRAGSGKSTTIAAFLKELMAHRFVHLLTLEDPIEFLHSSEGSFISQRELGRDFHSFPGALRNALREMPDVILVGEIRDPDTMQMALEAASTGIFVLGTLHTRGAAETAMRVESLFPLDQRDAIRDRFADVFTGIFSQCLLPSAGGGRVCATEVLLSTPAARNLIRQGKYNQLVSLMMSSPGMNTMEQAIKKLGKRIE